MLNRTCAQLDFYGKTSKARVSKTIKRKVAYVRKLFEAQRKFWDFVAKKGDCKHGQSK